MMISVVLPFDDNLFDQTESSDAHTDDRHCTHSEAYIQDMFLVSTFTVTVPVTITVIFTDTVVCPKGRKKEMKKL